MGKSRNWIASEYEYIQDNWGTVSIKTICKKLNRSENAISIKAFRLGLGSFLESGEYITFNQLLKAIGYGGGYSYKTTSWIENRNFPIKYKTVNRCKFKVVYISDFWKWAEKNKDFIDFSKMQENSLGVEPSWVKEQRRLDFNKNIKYKSCPWNKAEDSRLIELLKLQKYGYLELSQALNRTAGAIQRRCCDLGLKERPVKADNHNPWSNDDLNNLALCINQCMGYELTSEIIGRSSKAIRGKVYACYHTENLDVVREFLNGNQWGVNAPLPTVEQSKRKAKTKDNLSKLAGLIASRRNSLGWSDYWQKDLCMHWHEMNGCTKEQENCDVCACFQRIPPQYCVRCGKTFFERTVNRICEPCRKARKSQAARKYLRNKSGVCNLENEVNE